MTKLPNIRIKKLFLTMVISGLVLSIVTVAVAQEIQRTVTEAYPSLTHKLNPGDNAEGITRIINQSSVPLKFSVGVSDFIVSDTLGTPNILPPGTLNEKYSAASWIGITPDTFTLAPGEKQTLNYYIQVPKDARPGGHYAAIVYSPLVDNTVEGSGGTVQGKLGSLFYITVNGPVTERSIISNFFVNNFQEYGPIKVSTQIKNLGDLHISPQATVSINGFLFNQTQSLEKHNIFPGSARDFENVFSDDFMIGRYKAVLLGSYGVENSLQLSATAYFWVFPWRMTLVVILLVIAIILGILYFKKRKKINHHEDKETKPASELPENK